MRIASVGAFPFPLAQGSQVFARDQARALRAAGAELTLFCYGVGDGEAPHDLELVRVPRPLSPSLLRAGPAARKPVADVWLAGALAAQQQRRRFDALLAHNAEAALAALGARALCGVPVVYVAHTLLAEELDAWAPAAAGAARALGAALDRRLASHSDAVLALCSAAAQALSPHAGGPVEVIPPGLDPRPEPDEPALRAACARCGVEPRRYVLYSGNVDSYQDLDVLAEAAALATAWPVVVATHGSRRIDDARLRCLRTTPEEARTLAFGAAACVLPRRRRGGFPIKLLGYMEAGRPIVARRGVADGLEDGVSAVLLPDGAGAAGFAEALRGLAADPERAERLGHSARQTLERRHAWDGLAHRTLELVSRGVCARRSR